ncbi:centromere protein C-like [Ptychodera flava]|uniref:centromere protein C-like n=1 Tax=Ptychodera flava TaxID=63121 RepID=UPI00396AB0D2
MAGIVQEKGHVPKGLAFPYILKGKIGRRTGIQLTANARRDSEGYEIFDDYWSDNSDKSDDEISMSSSMSETNCKTVETNGTQKKLKTIRQPSPPPRRMSSFSPVAPSSGTPLTESTKKVDKKLDTTYTCSPTVQKSKTSDVTDGSQIQECQVTSEEAFITGSIIKNPPSQNPSSAVKDFNMKRRLTFSAVSAEDSEPEEKQTDGNHVNNHICVADNKQYEHQNGETENIPEEDHLQDVDSTDTVPTETSHKERLQPIVTSSEKETDTDFKTSDSEITNERYLTLKSHVTSTIEMLSRIHQDTTNEGERGESPDFVIVDEEDHVLGSRKKATFESRQKRLQKSTGKGKGKGSQFESHKKKMGQESGGSDSRLITSSVRKLTVKGTEQSKQDLITETETGQKSKDEAETVARRGRGQQGHTEEESLAGDNDIVMDNDVSEVEDNEALASEKKATPEQKRKSKSSTKSSDGSHSKGDTSVGEEDREIVSEKPIETGKKAGKGKKSTVKSSTGKYTSHRSIFSSFVSSDEETEVMKEDKKINRSAKSKLNKKNTGKRTKPADEELLSGSPGNEGDVPSTGMRKRGRSSVKKQNTRKGSSKEKIVESESELEDDVRTAKRKTPASKAKLSERKRGKPKKKTEEEKGDLEMNRNTGKSTGQKRTKKAVQSNKKAEQSNKKAVQSNKKAVQSNKKAVQSNKKAEQSNKKAVQSNKKAVQSNKKTKANQERSQVKGSAHRQRQHPRVVYSEDDTFQAETDDEMTNQWSQAEQQSVPLSDTEQSEINRNKVIFANDNLISPTEKILSPHLGSGTRHSSRRKSKPKEYWKVSSDDASTVPLAADMASHKTKRSKKIKEIDQDAGVAGKQGTVRKSSKKGRDTSTAKKNQQVQRSTKRKSEAKSAGPKKSQRKSAVAKMNSYLELSDPNELYSTLMEDLDGDNEEQSVGQSYIAEPSPAKKRRGQQTPQKSPRKPIQPHFDEDDDDDNDDNDNDEQYDDNYDGQSMNVEMEETDETLIESWQHSGESEESETITPQSFNKGPMDSYESSDEDRPIPRKTIAKGTKLKKVQLIEPKSGTPGLRRSRRCRVGPTRYWMNERPIYEKRKSGGFVLTNVQTPFVPDESKGRRIAKRQRMAKSPVDMSLHGDVEDSFEEDAAPLITTFDSSQNREVEMDCVRSGSALEYVGPTGRNATANDSIAITKALDTEKFAMGKLVLRPLQEKPAQLVRTDTLAFHIIKGKIMVEIHHTKVLLQAGDYFYVPTGNSYSVRNLRKDEAILSYFLLKQTK